VLASSKTAILQEVLRALGGCNLEFSLEAHLDALRSEADALGCPTDLQKLAKTVGIDRVNYISMHCDGALVPRGEYGYEAYISTAASPMRQRFSLAHEIAHAIIHALVPATRKFETRNVFFPPGHETEERLCDFIASRILMPTSAFWPHVVGRSLSYEMLANISKEFYCSLTATALRCRDALGVSVALIQCKAYSAAGIAVFERRLLGFKRSRFGFAVGTRFEGAEVIPIAAASGKIVYGPSRLRSEGTIYDLFIEAAPVGLKKNEFPLMCILSPVSFRDIKFPRQPAFLADTYTSALS